MQTLLLASTILLIGDSHSVGPFGWTLDQDLRDKGHQVASYASCGSIGKWWEEGRKTTCGYFSKTIEGKITQANTHVTPNLKELLRTVKPDYVIVELASNYVGTPSDKFVIGDIRDVIKAIRTAHAKCFWVGAPDMRKFRTELPRLRRLLDEAVGADCELFDSESVTNYPATGGDGIHYWSAAGTPIARGWAKAVSEEFQRFVERE